MNWLKTLALAIGAALLAMGLGMLGRAGRQQKKAEAREIGYLATGGAKATAKAKAQAAKAEVHKADAKKAAEIGIAVIERVKDENISDTISNWTR